MIDQLRQRLRALQKIVGIVDGARTLPLGIAAIDDALGGGLARGALHEIAAASEAHLAAATGFALGLAARGRIRVFWIAEDMALAESGAPYGAGLDVFEREPLEAESPLWAMENTILTPHMSGAFKGYVETCCELFADNLRRFAAGQPLLNQVDAALGY